MDVNAISNALGDNGFILGSKPCGYDASIHSTLAGISILHFDIKIGAYVRQNPCLMAYIARMINYTIPRQNII
jgi:hypothetical protein